MATCEGEQTCVDGGVCRERGWKACVCVWAGRERAAVVQASWSCAACSTRARPLLKCCRIFWEAPSLFLFFFLAGRMVGSRILVGPACQSGSITTRSLPPPPPPRLAQRCTEVPGRKRSFHIERKKWEIVHTGKPTKGRSESTARGLFPVLDCRSYKGGGTVSPGLSSPPGPDNRLQPEVRSLDAHRPAACSLHTSSFWPACCCHSTRRPTAAARLDAWDFLSLRLLDCVVPSGTPCPALVALLSIAPIFDSWTCF